jgi:hypothetical protein
MGNTTSKPEPASCISQEKIVDTIERARKCIQRSQECIRQTRIMQKSTRLMIEESRCKQRLNR